MDQSVTPLSDGVFLNEREIDSALSLNRKFNALKCDLVKFANLLRVDFRHIDDWPDEHGIYFKRLGQPHIWIPHSTPFFEFLTFCHEYHHYIFAPDMCLAKQKDRVRTARYEGKASAFAAIAAMPQLEYLNEQDIYRAFGLPFRYCAHYRILHFRKHGW